MKKKLGSDDFVDIFWVITNWTIFRGHFYAFKDLFLRLRYRMGIFLGVAKISNIFGCLKLLIFFRVNGRCWARAYL